MKGLVKTTFSKDEIDFFKFLLEKICRDMIDYEKAKQKQPIEVEQTNFILRLFKVKKYKDVDLPPTPIGFWEMDGCLFSDGSYKVLCDLLNLLNFADEGRVFISEKMCSDIIDLKEYRYIYDDYLKSKRGEK